MCRAFARKADVYILDEPNAALDAISEYQLSGMYEEILNNNCGVIIAHRFNNFIKKADKIIVLEDGMVVESGTHEKLILNNGIYSELYKLQVE